MTARPFPPLVQHLSLWFLYLVPCIAGVLGALRPLRTPGRYQTIGGCVFLAIIAAIFLLMSRTDASARTDSRLHGLASALLLIPFTLIALLWVGLATPWDATPPENQMRYVVLLASAIAVTIGFMSLKELLADAGERFYSMLGYGTGLLAGAAYLIWLTFQIGIWSAQIRHADIGTSGGWINDALDTLLFAACVLTYLASAAFAASFGIVGWCRKGTAFAAVFISLAACALIIARGLSFPDPTASTTPWYARPGFIAGIPAIPWLIPHILGVLLLHTKTHRSF